ncbi:MAG: RNA pseudouridine synthase, partial [Candidatus Omnitrophica bacterium]|nr:RNA pseudouridine synthase [Candidatus Omnitrophota bacterium]
MEKKGFSRVEVTEADNGTRLDKFVTGKMGDKYSRVFLQRLITDGHILVDGIHRKNHYDVTPGEYIEIDIPPAKRCHIKAEKIPLNIVYEDSSVLVVNKTPDMVVHP